MRLIICLFLSLSISTADVCEQVFQPKKFKASIVSEIVSEPASAYFDEFEVLVSRFPGIDYRYRFVVGKNLKFRQQVESFEEIPLELSHRFRPPASRNRGVLVERFNELEPKMQEAIVKAYNVLNDPDIIARYMRELYAESMVYMVGKEGLEKVQMMLTEGLVSYRAVAVTIIRRLKARKDTKFTKITRQNVETGTYIISGKQRVAPEVAQNRNQAFRAAVRNGPFIDGFFKEFSDHGAYAHLIQRDILHVHLKKILGDDVSGFYEYMGTQKGVAFWADIFDADEAFEYSFTNPEAVTGIIGKHLSGISSAY